MSYLRSAMLLLYACAGPSEELAPSCAAPSELSVLSYNVHGLPPEITGDDTGARLASIGPMLSAWDLAGVQEDWIPDNHDVLVAAAGQSTQEWFDTPLEDRVYGAGLSQLTNLTANDYFEQHYSACNGTLEGASDCFASKGFQVMRICLGDGLELDWYNSHFEAGSGDADNAARATGVGEIAASMNALSAGRAVLFTGDTNLDVGDPEDDPLLARLANEAGLSDACEAVDCPEPTHIDRILFRDGAYVHLEVTAWAREEAFVDDAGVDLSDHPAISARVRWSAP